MFLYRVYSRDGGAYQGLRIATTQSSLGAVVIGAEMWFAISIYAVYIHARTCPICLFGRSSVVPDH